VHGFRNFILRGNLIELAVAFVMGAAFTALVTSFVSGFVTPLIALVAGKHDFDGLRFTISGTTFQYGVFVTALVSFLSVAAVLYYLVVLPYEHVRARLEGEPGDEPAPRVPCPYCVSDIPAAATRCPSCTSQLA
jgi:large conductance mechanosensitive channel